MEKDQQQFCTRMRLKEEKQWTNKMINILLEDVPYKICGNNYRRGCPIRLYSVKDIEEIEKTEEYKKLKEKADNNRIKRKEREKQRLEQKKLEEEKKLKELAQFYEQEYNTIHINKSFKKANWQEKCLNNIKDKSNIIISSPTGSGKTVVFLEWALNKNERPIFITAPIKALSNQRYRDLKHLGYNVGLETGDIKKIPENCDIICCTQEIYTNKYINNENTTLIIDEFHYIFEAEERSRTYIDGLRNSKATNICICSATFGNLTEVKKYIDRITDKKFYLYESKERLSELIFEGEIDSNKITNALIIAFSVRHCNLIANEICNIRQEIETVSDKCKTKYIDNYNEIMKIATKMKINNSELLEHMRYGISTYYGKLLPKEKLFVEEVFEKRLIDTVIGTDALALGVNFPVETVVFAELLKNENKISKNLFQQIAGRAGRKGYFDIGYVYYCPDFLRDDYYYNYYLYYKYEYYKYEYYKYKYYKDEYYEEEYYEYDRELEDLYKELLDKEYENICIKIKPDFANILKGKTTIEKEAEYIVKYSTNELDINDIKSCITQELNFIPAYIKNNYEYSKTASKIYYEIKNTFKNNIAEAYFNEYTLEENCYILSEILEKKSIGEIIKGMKFYELLQFRRYIRHLPKELRNNINISKLEKKINNIDSTALNI